MPRIIFQQLLPDRRRDVFAALQQLRGAFGTICMRVIGGVEEQVFANFFNDFREKPFVALATEKYSSGSEIITRRSADEILGAVTGIIKMIVHPLEVRRHPADAAFEESKL